MLFRSELQKQLMDSQNKINWVFKKNLHLTLKFFGEVNESDIKKIEDTLARTKFKPFKTKLSGMGVFPTESYIKVVWVGLNPDKEVLALQRLIDEEFLESFPAEQSFVAHLTLGRVKFVKDKEKYVERLKKVKIKELEFEVNNFKLFKSVLSKEGPKYSVLKVIS